MISINMELAKQIWRDKIRADRLSLLEKLDILFLRAIETNNINEQTNISILKQKLRDAPSDPRIDSAQNPDELSNINPLLEIKI